MGQCNSLLAKDEGRKTATVEMAHHCTVALPPSYWFY